MEIKSKVELKAKGEVANLPEIKQAKITMSWSSSVDLDLMAFIELQDGTTSGVFSSNLGGSHGELNSFPFMTLSEDAGVGAQGGENQETIIMTKVDSTISVNRFVTLNYTDAAAKKADANFNDYDEKITFVNQSGESFEVDLDTAGQVGTAALLATIEVGPIGATICNESVIMDLAKLVETVPGARALLK